MVLVVHPHAEDDVIHIVEWYDKAKSGLGQDFLYDFYKTALLIRKYPLIFRVRYNQIRICRVGNRFPYFIHYQFLARSKTVLLLGGVSC